MPSAEFAKAVRDLSQFGENITIACTNDGIEFSAAGDTGAGKFIYCSYHTYHTNFCLLLVVPGK